MIQPTIPPRLIERITMYSPIGLQLVDDFTGGPPLGRIVADLQERDPAAASPSPPSWTSAGRRAVVGPSGVLTYPGLGRSSRPAETPVRRFRVVIAAEYYTPRYPPLTSGFEFDVHAYNDSNPPAALPLGLTKAPLIPSRNYPFPSGVRVLRGRVVDAGGPFHLNLRWWGNGSTVPTSGNRLLIVGIDNAGLLHIRVFNARGAMIVNTDESKLGGLQGAAAVKLCPKVANVLPPNVPSPNDKAWVASEALSLVGSMLQGRPIAGALLNVSNVDGAASDESGEFVLPIGRLKLNNWFVIDVIDPAGRVKQFRKILTDDPVPGLTLTIP